MKENMANLSDDATASQSPNHAKRMRIMRFLVRRPDSFRNRSCCHLVVILPQL